MTKIITKNREFEVSKQNERNYFRKLPEDHIYKIKIIHRIESMLGFEEKAENIYFDQK